MIQRLKKPLVSLVLAAALAPISSASSADGFGFALSKKVHHGVLSFGFFIDPFRDMFCAAPPAPPSWTPGHYETVCRPVWVEGCEERVWVQPVYRWERDRCGRPVWMCVRPGHYEMLRRPGRYENHEDRIWIEGSWRS